MENSTLRIIISGGGTGGHLFPALSIADKLKELNPGHEILFVGAEGRMEMEKVPAAGYEIRGLPMAGLQRKLTFKNLLHNLRVPFKILRSLALSRKILREFRPDLAIGVGGYASAPLLWTAARAKIPTLLQEQNGFAGLANKILGKRAACICVAYEGMERFFPAEKILLTGNPIRKDLSQPATPEMRAEALNHYGLDPECRQVLVLGGSLGSGTLNAAVKQWITSGSKGGERMEVLWQCGKHYREDVDRFMAEARPARVHPFAFIRRMDLAYAAADLVISRSGASTVSELCALHKAVLFVPSPNVAEDHQTHNAMALAGKGAAEIVTDAEAVGTLMEKAAALLSEPGKIAEMERRIAAFARPDAALRIAEEACRLARRRKQD